MEWCAEFAVGLVDDRVLGFFDPGEVGARFDLGLRRWRVEQDGVVDEEEGVVAVGHALVEELFCSLELVLYVERFWWFPKGEMGAEQFGGDGENECLTAYLMLHIKKREKHYYKMVTFSLLCAIEIVGEEALVIEPEEVVASSLLRFILSGGEQLGDVVIDLGCADGKDGGFLDAAHVIEEFGRLESEVLWYDNGWWEWSVGGEHAFVVIPGLGLDAGHDGEVFFEGVGRDDFLFGELEVGIDDVCCLVVLRRVCEKDDIYVLALEHLAEMLGFLGAFMGECLL